MTAGYRQWLETLNYPPSTIYYYPRLVVEFLTWSEVQLIEQIDHEMITGWIAYQSTRKNKRRAGGISLKTIKKYRSALSQFSRFLRETGQESFEVPPKVLEQADVNMAEQSKHTVLTREEINQLYEATHYYPDPGINDRGLLAARERALLGLYYGCGLRRKEGLHVELKDLDFRKNLLHVRKGKNYKERHVPIAGSVKKDFIHYLGYARPQLLRREAHPRFLVSWTGQPLQGQGIIGRLHILKGIARIEKPATLHTLRHSIATHLLESGMRLEQIARFLGHGSLESTHIYTHIANEKV